MSDVDLVAVTHPGRWEEAWDDRQRLSSGALITHDRSEGEPEIAGHSWLAPSLVKVECLITAPGRMRLRGNVVVLLGEDDLPELFERIAPFTVGRSTTTPPDSATPTRSLTSNAHTATSLLCFTAKSARRQMQTNHSGDIPEHWPRRLRFYQASGRDPAGSSFTRVQRDRSPGSGGR